MRDAQMGRKKENKEKREICGGWQLNNDTRERERERERERRGTEYEYTELQMN